MNDVIVVTNLDSKPRAADDPGVLILSTNGVKKIDTYYSLDEIMTAFGGTSSAYKKAKALFEQGKTSLAETLVRKVKIAGIAPPATPAELLAELEDLRQIDDDWYILMTDLTDDESISAICAWVESTEPTEAELGAGIEDHRKMYFGETNNKNLEISNRRCVLVYTENFDENADAAYLGNVIPHYPSSVSWKFKKPDGLTVWELTMGEKNQLDERHINYLTSEYKRIYMKQGVCCDGEFIDVQLGADYITRYMRERIYNLLLSKAVIPYTNSGFSLIAGEVYSALNRATQLGIIALDSKRERGVYSVKVPRREEATDDQARSRTMPTITWDAALSGAVHLVKISGVLRANYVTGEVM